MKLTKRAKSIIFIIFLVFFAYVNYSFVYQPRNDKITELNQRITTLEEKIAEGNRIASRLNDLKKEYAELKERLEFIEVLLPKEKDIPDFLVLLQDTMDEFNIDFSNFSPQSLIQERDAIYTRLPISMTYNANYFEVINFLDRLENFPRIVDVKELKLNPSSDEDEKDNVNVNMSMFTYVLMKGKN